MIVVLQAFLFILYVWLCLWHHGVRNVYFAFSTCPNHLASHVIFPHMVLYSVTCHISPHGPLLCDVSYFPTCSLLCGMSRSWSRGGWCNVASVLYDHIHVMGSAKPSSWDFLYISYPLDSRWCCYCSAIILTCLLSLSGDLSYIMNSFTYSSTWPSSFSLSALVPSPLCSCLHWYPSDPLFPPWRWSHMRKATGVITYFKFVSQLHGAKLRAS